MTTQTTEENPHLKALGYKLGSVVQIVDTEVDPLKHLNGQLAYLVGGNAESVSFRTPVLHNDHRGEEYGWVTYTLPWGTLGLQLVDEGGAPACLNYWFKYADGLVRPHAPPRFDDYDLATMTGVEARPLLKEFAASRTADELFALIELSCDMHGVVAVLDVGHDPSADDQWRMALAWRSYDLGSDDALALRACLLEAFLGAPREFAVTFVERVNASLDALAQTDCPRLTRDGWELGRIALIGMAWNLLRERWSELESMFAPSRAIVLELLRHALAIEYESVQEMSAFWVGTPPLLDMKEEHDGVVAEALKAYMAKPEVPWTTFRDFLYGGGFDAAMPTLATFGVYREHLASEMLQRWIIEPDQVVFDTEDALVFNEEDQQAAGEALLARFADLKADIAAELLAADRPFWKAFGSRHLARITEALRTRRGDRNYVFALHNHLLESQFAVDIRILLR